MLARLFHTRHLTPMQAAIGSILTYAFFAFSDSMGKWLQDAGFHQSLILVATSVPSFIVLSALLWKRRGLKRMYHTSYLKLHIARGLSLIGITYFVFRAVDTLPLADFYGIIFTVPFLITIGARLFFKERAALQDWICIALGFGGVLIVAQPDLNNLNPGYFYAMAQALCITAAALICRGIGRDENPYIFVVFANIAIIAVNIWPAFHHAIPEITWLHFGVTAVYAVIIPTAIMMMSAIFARASSVTHVIPYQYTQIAWGAIIGYLVFNDVPAWNVVAGAGIVIASGLYILFYHARVNKKSKA